MKKELVILDIRHTKKIQEVIAKKWQVPVQYIQDNWQEIIKLKMTIENAERAVIYGEMASNFNSAVRNFIIKIKNFFKK